MDPAALLNAAGVLLLGVSAGVFFAYQNSVLPGLKRLDDRLFATAMNAFNRAILNAAFMLAFLGSPLVVGAAAVVSFAIGQPIRGWILAASTLVYLMLVVGMTGAVNVPLNTALAATGERRPFERRWVRFNAVRTAGAIVAFALAIAGLLVGP